LHDATDLLALIQTWTNPQKETHKAYPVHNYNAKQEEVIFKQIAGFGMVPEVQEHDNFPVDDFDTPYKQTVTMTKLGFSFEWSAESEETDKNGIYQPLSKKWAQAFLKTKNQKAADIHNFGFNSAYAWVDGKELYATDHGTASGTWANEPSSNLAFGPLALQQAIEEMLDVVEHRGDPDPKMGPFILHVPNALALYAEEVVQSLLRADTANNNTNAPIRSRIQMLNVDPYFTSTTAWFLQEADVNEQGMYLWQVRPLTVKEGFEARNDTHWVAASERYVYGIQDARGHWGTLGA
jgi:hypothetical protein